jgi:hypothetical protein
VAADVGGQQPLHPAGEVAIVARPEDKVEVVGHEAVAADPHGQSLAGQWEQIDECLEVGVIVEDASAAITAVDDVVADVSDGSASGAGHAEDPTGNSRDCQKVECPLLLFDCQKVECPLLLLIVAWRLSEPRAVAVSGLVSVISIPLPSHLHTDSRFNPWSRKLNAFRNQWLIL